MSTKRKYVLIDTVQQFRISYCIPVDLLQQENPDGVFDAIEWSKDSVTCRQVKEFSDQDIGETIVASRIISQDEMLEIFDKDNDYLTDWSTEQKIAWVDDWKAFDE